MMPVLPGTLPAPLQGPLQLTGLSLYCPCLRFLHSSPRDIIVLFSFVTICGDRLLRRTDLLCMCSDSEGSLQGGPREPPAVML